MSLFKGLEKMREKKPLKNPFKITFTGSDDMDLKVKIVGDISRFIRENHGKQIKLTLAILGDC